MTARFPLACIFILYYRSLLIIGVSSRCPPGWRHHADKCYASRPTASWHQAARSCRRVNALLVQPDHPATLNFLHGLATARHIKRFWIGANDERHRLGDYRFLDSRPLNQTLVPWSAHYPNRQRDDRWSAVKDSKKSIPTVLSNSLRICQTFL